MDASIQPPSALESDKVTTILNLPFVGKEQVSSLLSLEVVDLTGF